MIAVKKKGDYERNGKGRVKTYGSPKDVYAHYRCWDDKKLKTIYGVEIVEVDKKELREANE